MELKVYDNYCKSCSTGVNGCVSCCESPFHETPPGFWLTLHDIAHIVNTRRIPPEAFCRYEAVPEAEDDDDGDIDEVYGELMFHGDKTILMDSKALDDPTSSCIFLGKQGCTIFDDRPKMCRIYPFWFKEVDGKVVITIDSEGRRKDDDCLITKTHFRNKNIPFMLTTTNDTEEHMRDQIVEYISEMHHHNSHKAQLESTSIMDLLVSLGLVTEQTKKEIYASFDENTLIHEQMQRQNQNKA